MFNLKSIFKKKQHYLSQKEVDVLIKKLEQYAQERAILNQYLAEQLGDKVCPGNYMPSEEMTDKYGKWIRRSNQVYIWGIVEKFCQAYKENHEVKN